MKTLVPSRAGLLPLLRFLTLHRRKAALLLIASGNIAGATAGEVAAFARVFGWPDGTSNFSTYTKAAGGTVTKSQSGNGWKSFGTSSFHALAAGGSATTPGTAGFSTGYVGGSAYWFEQITISSPSVPAGTVGRAEFTLYFDGHVSAGPPNPFQSGLYSSSIGYRWACIPVADGGDNVADPNVGESYTERVDVWPSYSETIGGDFRNQPRHHQVVFRYGQPFDFTVAIHCAAEAWRNSPSKVRAELRCTGWNGFRNFHIPLDLNAPGGIPVTDATVSAPSGFDYATPGTTSYAQWASLYQLDASSMQADANGNGLPNLLEYALGRHPAEVNPGPAVASGIVNVGGTHYPSITFTRPRLGARPGDITYLPQRGDNLGTWSNSGLEMTVAPSDSDRETVTVRSTQPLGSQNREFLRLDVTGP